MVFPLHIEMMLSVARAHRDRFEDLAAMYELGKFHGIMAALSLIKQHDTNPENRQAADAAFALLEDYAKERIV